MGVRFNLLGPKLILVTLAFLTALAVSTALLITAGFRQTQREGLTAQGQESLFALTQLQGQISTTEFQQAVQAGQQAADYMVRTAQLGGNLPWDSERELERQATGQYVNANPGRNSDVFVPNTVKVIDGEVERDLKVSAALDALAPAILAGNQDTSGLYYINPHGSTRYYPVIGLGDLVPPDFAVTEQPFYAVATPENNPKRETVWTAPYVDPAGQGLMVTASTPVYVGDSFRGVIGIDVTLTRLIDRLQNLKPTPHSYAFLVDQNGLLVAADPLALPHIAEQQASATASITTTLGLNLTTTKDGAFRAALDAMRSGTQGVTRLTLGGTPVFLAHAPLSNLGWSLAVVAPVDEVTGQSDAVNTATRNAVNATLLATLATMGVVFAVVLGGIVFFSRSITRPIRALVDGATAVARGDLNISIPVTSKDELGVLAQNFNQMIGHLQAQRAELQERNQELQHSIESQQQLFATVKQLATPLLPILDDVVVLPIVGHLDSQRAQDLMTTLLQGVAAHRARVAILDVTGIPMVDTHVLKLLIQAVRATELLGAHVIVTGIKGAMAQIIIEQGVDLRDLNTFRDLRSAIESLVTDRSVQTA